MESKASRLYKCYGLCNEKYSKNELLEYGKKKYCKACLDSILKEKNEREELYLTIKTLFNVSYPTGMMLKQIKQYKEECGYTYKGMTLTLNYCSKMPGIDFKSTMGVGIIPHQYEKAKADYIKKAQQKSKMENTELKAKEVVIKIKKLDNTNHLKNERLIDLEDILND